MDHDVLGRVPAKRRGGVYPRPHQYAKNSRPQAILWAGVPLSSPGCGGWKRVGINPTIRLRGDKRSLPLFEKQACGQSDLTRTGDHGGRRKDPVPWYRRGGVYPRPHQYAKDSRPQAILWAGVPLSSPGCGGRKRVGINPTPTLVALHCRFCLESQGKIH